MPRYSLRSAALFVVAFCLSWQSAGTGVSTAEAGCGDYVHLGRMESTRYSNRKSTAVADALFNSLLKEGNRHRAATVREWFSRELLATRSAPLRSRLDFQRAVSLAARGLDLMLPERELPGQELPSQGSPRRPCDGPHCRQQPLTPAAPLPAPVISGSQQKACLTEQAVRMLPVSHVLNLEVAVRHDELPESRIDRPPRRCS